MYFIIEKSDYQQTICERLNDVYALHNDVYATHDVQLCTYVFLVLKGRICNAMM